MTIEPFTLRGRHVELVPLTVELVEPLVAAAVGDRATYEYTDVPGTIDAMAAYVGRMLAMGAAGTAVPFAQRRTRDRQVIGCTRYLELRWWYGRDAPDEVEIGGTWLAADAQRTPINTEAKLLLLTHAFDVWQVRRVALCTDSRNQRSRDAIARIGARFEGILRHHRPSTVRGEAGRLRDTAMFAMTDDDWPGVRQRLSTRLGSPTVQR